MNCTGIAVIIGVTDEDKLVLVEQHRIPVRGKVIEFPAGLANDSATGPRETLQEAAKRELLEETGYAAADAELIFEGPSSQASTSDILSFFHATGLEKAGEGGGDHTESISVHEVPVPDVDDWLRRQQAKGLLVDPRIYAGLYYLRRARNAGDRPRERSEQGPA
ncbi:MAG: NUDIX hydrolase [Elusimicrobiota bacterium]